MIDPVSGVGVAQGPMVTIEYSFLFTLYNYSFPGPSGIYGVTVHRGPEYYQQLRVVYMN